MNSILLAGLNLVAFLFVASFLAQSIALRHWRGRGSGAILLLIVVCGQVWLVPQALSFFVFHSTRLMVELWFGNWIASGVGAVLFALRFRNQSRDLLDAARLDGNGSWGIYRHVIWPSLGPTLIVLAGVLLMATWMDFAGSTATFLSVSTTSAVPRTIPELALVLAASFAATLPVMALFLFARARLTDPMRTPAAD